MPLFVKPLEQMELQRQNGAAAAVVWMWPLAHTSLPSTSWVFIVSSPSQLATDPGRNLPASAWPRPGFDHYLTSRDGGLLVSSLVIFVAVADAAFCTISLFGLHQLLANDEPQDGLQQ